MSATPPIPSFNMANSAPLPPPRVPDHELIRRIGRGAYGEVWLARCVLGTYRAVKIVHRRSFDHDRPFEREFEGILKFEPVSRTHESQVDILHVGRGDGCFYYVMELADDQATGGQINPDAYAPRTLKSDLMFHGRLPFEECVRIGIALATALEHLHANGLVHRDVKPSNIIFVNGVPKLADIGLVTGVDATRSYVGTEGFAAPEGPGTPQADLFSLGKVLYEIATGKDRQEFPELPTQLRELPDREGLMELNAVIARACRHDPKDRYASAAAMRADLELLQSGKSLARLHRTEARLRFVQRAGAAVTALAALIAAGWLWEARQTKLVRALAAEKASLAEQTSKLSEQNREQLVRLSVANGVRLLDEGDSTAALLWFAQALPLVTNRPAEEEIHRIRIQQVLDQTPRPLLLVPGGKTVLAGAFSPDGRRVATATISGAGTKLEIWDSHSGQVIWEVKYDGKWTGQLQFSRDGRRLLMCSSQVQGQAAYAFDRTVIDYHSPHFQIAAALDAETGEPAFPAFTSNLLCSAFSPDDRWLALARTNHVIELHDTRDGRLLVEVKGHTDEIRMLSFNASGTLLASCGRDQTVRLWRVPSGEAHAPALNHDRPVVRAVLNDDGQRLLTATAASDSDPVCRVQLWDTAMAQRIGPALAETNRVFALCFLPGDSNRFLLGGDRFEFEVRDCRTMQPIFAGIKLRSHARSWNFSLDGSVGVVGSDDGSAYVWDLATGKLRHPPFGTFGWKESVQFSPDGRSLLTTSEAGTAEVWPLQSASETARLLLPESLRMKPPAVHQPIGRNPAPIPVELEDGSVRLIDPKRLAEIANLRRQNNAMKFGPWFAGKSGRVWLTSEAGDFNWKSKTPCIVYLWKVEGSNLSSAMLPHPRPLRAAEFSSDDSRVVTLCADKVVRIWRSVDSNLEREVAVPNDFEFADPATLPWFTPDATAVVVLGMRGKEQVLELFDLASARPCGTPFPTARVSGKVRSRFSPDGGRLASVGDDQGLSIIDLWKGDLSAPWAKHGGGVSDVDWSPNGTKVVTAGLAPRAMIWNAATGELWHSPMTIGVKAARSARWSADGRFVFTRSDDNRARVWDAATTEAVTPLLEHAGYIRWGCITPGNRLITASDPNLLRAWDLKPITLPVAVIADYARLLAGRRLNENGVLIRLPADQLAELQRSLRQRAPQLLE